MLSCVDRAVFFLTFYITILLAQDLDEISVSGFQIPDVTLEAYKPKGFKATIEAIPGIGLFAFHANINKKISSSEVGELNADITRSQSKSFTYYDPNLQLKVGDYISYWVFVQHDYLGYRRENMIWNVTALIAEDDCEESVTYLVGKSKVCKGYLILEDKFDQDKIDTRNWLIEEYIPFYDPNYEFVSYQNNKDVCFIRNKSTLFIKPLADVEEREVLNLRKSCTRAADEECYMEKDVFIVPPVVSAKLVSKVKFRYGEVEVKAKLPAEIYLETQVNPNHTMWIAYARGNDRLISRNGAEDIGSRLLLGGPVLYAGEPKRSAYLRSKRYQQPVTKDFHVYKLRWSKEKIILSIDGVPFGEVDEATMRNIRFAQTDTVQLVLGVGVGGINDFPDGFKSTNEEPKPWVNFNSRNRKEFFQARSKWISTWKGDEAALQVDYVKITAL